MRSEERCNMVLNFGDSISQCLIDGVCVLGLELAYSVISVSGSVI